MKNIAEAINSYEKDIKLLERELEVAIRRNRTENNTLVNSLNSMRITETSRSASIEARVRENDEIDQDHAHTFILPPNPTTQIQTHTPLLPSNPTTQQ